MILDLVLFWWIGSIKFMVREKKYYEHDIGNGMLQTWLKVVLCWSWRSVPSPKWLDILGWKSCHTAFNLAPKVGSFLRISTTMRAYVEVSVLSATSSIGYLVDTSFDPQLVDLNNIFYFGVGLSNWFTNSLVVGWIMHTSLISCDMEFERHAMIIESCSSHEVKLRSPFLGSLLCIKFTLPFKMVFDQLRDHFK